MYPEETITGRHSKNFMGSSKIIKSWAESKFDRAGGVEIGNGDDGTWSVVVDETAISFAAGKWGDWISESPEPGVLGVDDPGADTPRTLKTECEKSGNWVPPSAMNAVGVSPLPVKGNGR